MLEFKPTSLAVWPDARILRIVLIASQNRDGPLSRPKKIGGNIAENKYANLQDITIIKPKNKSTERYYRHGYAVRFSQKY